MPQKLSKLEFAELVRSMPDASDEEILQAAHQATAAPEEPGFLSKATDAVKRYGKTVASDVGNLAMGVGKMIVTPPLEQARDMGIQAAMRVAAGDYKGLGGDVAETATGLPLRQMKEDFQQGNYPELAGHATVGAGMLLLPHMMGEGVHPVDAFSDPVRFTDVAKTPLRDGSPYGILTAANPQGQVLSAAENAARNAELVKALQAKGLKPVTQQGFFGGEPEPSFLVPGLSPEDAMALGKQFDQHSVISNQGLHRLADNQTFPIQDVRFPQDAKEYYSQIDFPGHGPVKYQMDIPPEAFEAPPSATETPKAVEQPLPVAADAKPGTAESLPPVKGSTPKAGASTAMAIAAPAAAVAIPDDPDSEWDDWARIALMGVGAVGAAAHFPKGLKKEMDAFVKTTKAEMKASGNAGKEAMLETGLRNFLRSKFPNDVEKQNHMYGTYRTIPLPTNYEGVNFDARYPTERLLKMGKDKAPEFSSLSKARLDKAYEVGNKVGSEWGTTEHLGKLTNNDPEAAMAIARMWGTYSPGNKTGPNTLMGIEGFIRSVLKGEHPRDYVNNMSTMNPRRPNVIPNNTERVVQGGRIYQKKTEALSAGEVGLNDLPIDLWFLRALGANFEKTPPAGVYEAVKTAARKAAAEKGEPLFPYMAKVWTGIQHIAGTPTPSFSRAVEQAGVPANITHPEVADWFLRNGKTMVQRLSKNGGDTLFDEPAPQVHTAAQYSDEDFTKQLQKRFVEARVKGDVLGKNKTTKKDNTANVQLFEQVLKALGEDLPAELKPKAEVVPFKRPAAKRPKKSYLAQAMNE